LLDLHKGRDAYTLLKSGVVDGLSIGFIPEKSHRKNGLCILDKINLFEVSLVTFTANPLAKVTSCKKWTDSYESTVSMMNRLKALRRAIASSDFVVKNLILESFI
jgi:phage head maturation protease